MTTPDEALADAIDVLHRNWPTGLRNKLDMLDKLVVMIRRDVDAERAGEVAIADRLTATETMLSNVANDRDRVEKERDELVGKPASVCGSCGADIRLTHTCFPKVSAPVSVPQGQEWFCQACREVVPVFGVHRVMGGSEKCYGPVTLRWPIPKPQEPVPTASAEKERWALILPEGINSLEAKSLTNGRLLSDADSYQWVKATGVEAVIKDVIAFAGRQEK